MNKKLAVILLALLISEVFVLSIGQHAAYASDIVTDNFDDDSIDTGIWEKFSYPSNDADTTEQNQQLEVLLASTGEIGGLNTKIRYDVSDTVISVDLVDPVVTQAQGIYLVSDIFRDATGVRNPELYPALFPLGYNIFKNPVYNTTRIRRNINNSSWAVISDTAWQSSSGSLKISVISVLGGSHVIYFFDDDVLIYSETFSANIPTDLFIVLYAYASAPYTGLAVFDNFAFSTETEPPPTPTPSPTPPPSASGWFTDDFDDYSLNVTMWEKFTYPSNDWETQEQNQQLEMALLSSGHIGGINTKTACDVSDALISAELVVNVSTHAQGIFLVSAVFRDTVGVRHPENYPALYPRGYYIYKNPVYNTTRIRRNIDGTQWSVISDNSVQSLNGSLKIMIANGTIHFYDDDVECYSETFYASIPTNLYIVLFAYASTPHLGTAIFDNFAYSAASEPPPPTPTPTPTPTPSPIPPVILSGETYYFRSDSYEVNTVTAYGLDKDFTNTAVNLSSNGETGATVQYGFRIYQLHTSGSKTELTGGSPEATITLSSNSSGYQTVTWSCAETDWDLGKDALQITIYVQFNSEYWTAVANHITYSIMSETLEASTWTFRVYLYYSDDGDSTQTRFYFGSGTYHSAILGVDFADSDIYTLMLFSLINGDLIMFFRLPLDSIFGSWWYFILIFAVAGAFYIRYRNLVIILVLFTLFGGAGGLVGLFIPNPVDIAIWVLLSLGLTAVLWRVFR